MSLAELQYLSLVSKVCTELDNHLGVSDKTLAEFIIDLAKKNPELPAFRAALDENGAEFPQSFAQSLLALIQRLMPKEQPKAAAAAPPRARAAPQDGPSARFPGLASANDSSERRRALEEEALGGVKAVADPGVASLRRGGGKAAERMPPPPPPPPPPGDGPVEAGRIYAGKVSNVMDFGCFVQLDGVKGRAEGLVHVSLIQSAPLRTPADAVKRGQPCYVKVLSVTGSKMSLSMRDADQTSGADLNPSMRLPGQATNQLQPLSNPTRDEGAGEKRRREI